MRYGEAGSPLQAFPRKRAGRSWKGANYAFGARRSDCSALGLSYTEMIAVVLALRSADFYKSMTTYADHIIWQDVYRPKTVAGDVYLKLTVIDDVLIVSFKEL